MNIRRIVPNISSALADESREFYTELLGFRVVMDMEWIVTLASPENDTAQLSLIRGEPSSSPQPDVTLTIEVTDVDAVHAKATSRGDDIVYPLTDEPWGVRRFHVRDPNGVVVNVMSHTSI